MIGTPPMCGAAATIDGVARPVRRSVASHGGTMIPTPRSISQKYPDHEIATATLPTAYSMIRSQPMIHAISSPRVA